MRKMAYLLNYSLLSLLFLGCGNFSTRPPAGAPEIYKNQWLITGTITDPTYVHGKVMAFGMDGARYSSSINKNSRFGIELPGNSTMALYFISAPNELDTRTSAMLVFEDSPDIGISDSLRLPEVMFNRNLFLGEIDIKSSQAYPTINPALTLDFDMDGIPDIIDRDDQNDHLDDYTQKRNLEHIKICHFNSESSGETQTIPLAHMLLHMEHGDSVGGCRYTQPETEGQL